MLKDKFYDSLRSSLNLTTQNVLGMEKCLEYAIVRRTPLQHLKYILSTAWWESAATMHPVKEAYWMSEEWRRRHLRYYPWYGRGLIQTTWETNYKTMSKVTGLDLIKNPDLLLTWEGALPALFIGMEKGLYTSKAIDDFIDLKDESDDEDLREMIQARRVVNVLDKAEKIGRLGLIFEKGLKAGEYNA